MSTPNWTAFGCEVLNYLKSRYTSTIIKADFNTFLAKAKAPKEITLGDAKRTAVTVGMMTGFFLAGEAFGKNTIVGYNPGYDVDAKTLISKRD
ncbi:hypothetical protein DICPUDRAFT_89350 [Dictyostelium purpureum]|uniref:Uncharacterized protein n=1 Tax=Dictyostelium purpureum TaxID=5786 RepID=F0ZVC0_DICPU|nr:uncharacterized protein DICPUDRAFT_89350 [Dictyostelium purpureum]EGC32119.1 hypothetical protein DICPUDRAFT_89350 [Dictyostelium purpureum]|eukprot:XP_003291369.1 hypothetical protein DICPUDRAFT_89350 [Dictyostelium purpureum]